MVFGLPNKIHAAKCEEVRPEVEAALAAHFGRPTPLRIVVDTAAPAAAQPRGDRERTAQQSPTPPRKWSISPS